MGHPPTLTGSYDPGLVLLSYLIAAVASFTALALARRVAKSEGASQWRWLVAGAFSMGLGIWSMHFVGMLAFSMGMPHSYDLPVTALSMGVGVLASGFALFIGSRKRISPGRLAVSGLVMGLGIAAMHYTGMAAMRMAAVVRYDPALFATSVLVAVLAATAALWIAFRVSSHADHHLGYMAGAALVMGLAICGMHYTGMAAAVYTHLPGAHHAPTTEPAGQVGLALVVGAATLVILFGTLLTVFFDYKLFVQRQVEGQLTRLVDERTRELTATVRDLERAEAVLRTHAHELGEAKEHAEAMLRLKSAFLANMSHEIRTPLTAIIGFAQLLAHEVAPEQRDLVDPIEKGGRRLLETLNSVLDLSQLESGTAPLHPLPLDVLAEAEETLLLLRPLADEKGLGVRLTGVPAVALADRA
ncbi:MAG TPA: MHYT domain-containing protein, partial [Rubricoccaceae bacterium]